ncbi:hypothetical protein BH10PSE14_BH10PSE14_19280 [soil metagenome]
MSGLVSQYFVDMVIVSMSVFSIVMIYVCVEDAVRHRDDSQTR